MENLNNLSPFYVGQKVVYITGKNMPKNSIHTISFVYKKDCGCWVVGINNIPLETDNGYSRRKCNLCNVIYITNGEKYVSGWSAKSFRGIQKFPIIKLSKVLEEQLICEN